jgi:anti-sigma regulatory factor (Ser/Thr protein kinase)
MTSFKRDLTTASALSSLPVIADFVEAACEQAQVDLSARFDLQLAIEEAVANVIEHAYKGEGGEFTLSIETVGRDVVITLHDHGRPFNPAAVARPNISAALCDRPIGGLGLHLMYQLMDDVRFAFDDSGNTLVMVKRGGVSNA